MSAARLRPEAALAYAHVMRRASIAILSAALVAATGPAALARTHHEHGHTRPARPDGPHAIGHFEDWTAATHREAGQTVCYAFTYPSASSPSVPGRGRVVLTVTRRPGAADAVAISAGYAYPPNAAVHVAVGPTMLNFYTAGRSAFARDGSAAIAAFRAGSRAVARGPMPRRGEVTDTFSLRGFAASFAAISRACRSR